MVQPPFNPNKEPHNHNKLTEMHLLPSNFVTVLLVFPLPHLTTWTIPNNSINDQIHFNFLLDSGCPWKHKTITKRHYMCVYKGHPKSSTAKLEPWRSDTPNQSFMALTRKIVEVKIVKVERPSKAMVTKSKFSSNKYS